MFKRSKFIFNANICLAKLGIDSLSIDSKFRSSIIATSFEAGETPEEASVRIFHEIGIVHQPMDSEVMIEEWIQEGKVRNSIWLL